MQIERYQYKYFIHEFPYDEYSSELYDFLFSFPKEDEVFLFSFYEEKFDYISADYKKFLEDRTVFISDEWMRNGPSYGRTEINRWFLILDKEDMARTLEDEFWFLCVVVKKGGGLQDASYILEMRDIEGPSLCITEKKQGDFLTRVLPKLHEVISEKIEIVQPGQ